MTKREHMGPAPGRQPVERLPVPTNFTPRMGGKLADFFRVSAKELSVLTMCLLLLAARFAGTATLVGDWPPVWKPGS